MRRRLATALRQGHPRNACRCKSSFRTGRGPRVVPRPLDQSSRKSLRFGWFARTSRACSLLSHDRLLIGSIARRRQCGQSGALNPSSCHSLRFKGARPRHQFTAPKRDPFRIPAAFPWHVVLASRSARHSECGFPARDGRTVGIVALSDPRRHGFGHPGEPVDIPLVIAINGRGGDDEVGSAVFHSATGCSARSR